MTLKRSLSIHLRLRFSHSRLCRQDAATSLRYAFRIRRRTRTVWSRQSLCLSATRASAFSSTRGLYTPETTFSTSLVVDGRNGQLRRRAPSFELPAMGCPRRTQAHPIRVLLAQSRSTVLP